MGCCCADGDWLYLLRSSENWLSAAAVGRGRGPLGPGTVVDNCGGLDRAKMQRKIRSFFKLNLF